MKVEKTSYWVLETPYFFTDNYWGRKVLEDLGEKYGVESLEGALFQSREVCKEVAEDILRTYDSEWGWVNEVPGFPDSLDARQTFSEIRENHSGVSIFRGGEVRSRKVVQKIEKVIIDGKEWERKEEEVIFGEWERKDIGRMNIDISIYERKFSIIS